jgi:DNA gyrase inhibitor GyrI
MDSSEIKTAFGVLRVEADRVDVSSAAAGLYQQFVPRVEYYLDNEPISEARYRNLLARHQKGED